VALWSAILFMTWIIGVHGVQAIIMVTLNLAAASWIWRRVIWTLHRAFVILLALSMTLLIFLQPAIPFSWPWYTLIGLLVCVTVGILLSQAQKSR